ncbi:40703_t:CDS:2, partial [Gigaspora margarita]
MEIDLPKSGCTFTTFAEVRAVIKRYAIRTHTVIILGRTSKNPNGSSYKQAFFVCKKQGKYSGPNKKYTTSEQFSTVMRKLDQDNLGLIEKLHNDGLRTRDIFFVLNSISSKHTHKSDVYNAVSNIATKAIHNDEHDQDRAFIQAVFWAYYSAFLDFSVAMDVLVIDVTYKTNCFLIPLIIICSIDQF